MNDLPNVGRAEMEILRYVADHHPITVREVAEHIAATKGHVRTTVLNVMERLRKKNLLKRKKAGGVYQYSPVAPKMTLCRKLVRDFVERSLGGSVAPLVAFLTEEATLTETEIAELERLIADLKEEK